MKVRVKLSLGTIIGLCLFIIGVLLFYFVPPITYPLGKLATWAIIWPVYITLATGCALMLGFGFETYVKSMLAGVSALFVVSIIFLAPLPLDLQLFLMSLFAVIVLVLSRLYIRRRTKRPQMKMK